MTDLLTIADRVPDRGETITSTRFSTHHGGKGANSAVAAYRLSHNNPKNSGHTPVMGGETQVRMIGAVGADEFGPPLKEKLTASGVNTDGIRVVKDQPTGVGVVLVEEDFGENRILFHPGANYDLLPSEFTTLASLAGGVKPDLLISQLELRRETIEQVIETASREGIDVLLNPAPASYLMPRIYRMVTHLIVNETEAVMLSPSDIDRQDGWANVGNYFLRLGVKNVVVTLGAQGAYYLNESGGGYVEAEKQCIVVDTTGAGYVLNHTLRCYSLYSSHLLAS